MATLNQLRNGLSRTWEVVTEGWNYLRSHMSEALTRFQPPERRGDLQTAADRITANAARWALLPVEVIERRSEILVKLEAPGMRGEDFEIQTVGDVLVVRGEKTTQRSREEGRYHVLECAYGSFERAVHLPAEVTEEGARASYHQGVLEITLPKAVATGPRRISVQAG
jgi:HSP20 family protein